MSEEEEREFRMSLDAHIENGLFLEGNSKILDEIFDLLKNKSDQDRISKALNKFHEAVRNRGFRYKMTYIYGILHLIYLLAIFFAIVVLWLFGQIEGRSLFNIPSWSFMLGVLGSVCRGLWWLWYHINRHTFKKVWWTWFFSAPIIGGILGVIVYFSFLAGFIAATQSKILVIDAFPKLLTILAGYSWEWAVKLIDKVTGLTLS